MALPSAATKVYLDQIGDDPRLARAELATLVDTVNAIITHLGLQSITSTPLAIGYGLESAAGALYAKLDGGSLVRGAAGLRANYGTGGGQIPILDANGKLSVGTFLTTLDAQQQFRISTELVPTAIAGDQNDFAPNGIATATVLNLQASGAPRAITGLSGGADGRVILLDNIGAFPLTLKDQSGASSAANRFKFGTDYALNPGMQLALRWSASQNRWVFFTRPSSPTWQLVQSVVSTGVETELDLNLTSVPASAVELLIQWHGIQPLAGTASLRAVISIDGMATFDTGANYMEWGVIYNSVGGAAGLGIGVQAYWQLGYNLLTNVALTAAAPAAGRCMVQSPRSGGKPVFQSDIDYPTSAVVMEGGFHRGNHKGSPHTVDGYRLYFGPIGRAFAAGGTLEAYYR